MNIDKKDRAQLKKYFVKNSIPKESEFAELIDGMLNQKDDGIAKPSATDPLSIQATTDAAGVQKVINFYTDFKEVNPTWILSLNTPDPANPATLKTGFSINDGDGNNRLFIDKNTGNVGIGTIAPDAKLSVAGTLQVNSQIYAGNSDIYFTNTTHNHSGISNTKGYAAIENATDFDALMILGRAGTDKGRKVRLWDYLQVNGTMEATTMEATGTIIPSAGNGNNGIVFPSDPGGGSGDTAWIKYYSRVAGGESMTLEIGVSNDADDHIALMPSGNVGIGTTTPGAKLDINATTGTWGGWLEAIRFSRTEQSALTLPGGNLLFGMHSNRNFYFADTKDAGKYLMTINADTGNVGIGPDGAAFRLDVTGRVRIRQINGKADSAGIWFSSYGNYATEVNSSFVGMESLNQVGFYGNAGTAGWRLLVNTSSGDLTVTGNAFKPGGGAWGSNSDERLKQNIRPLEGALNKLLKLRGVQYEWKEPEKQGNLTGCQIGLIAQEVETVFPEWIGVDAQGYKTLTIRGFEALVIEAIKELRVENENLRKYCESLEARLKASKTEQVLEPPGGLHVSNS